MTSLSDITPLCISERQLGKTQEGDTSCGETPTEESHKLLNGKN